MPHKAHSNIRSHSRGHFSPHCQTLCHSPTQDLRIVFRLDAQEVCNKKYCRHWHQHHLQSNQSDTWLQRNPCQWSLQAVCTPSLSHILKSVSQPASYNLEYKKSVPLRSPLAIGSHICQNPIQNNCPPPTCAANLMRPVHFVFQLSNRRWYPPPEYYNTVCPPPQLPALFYCRLYTLLHCLQVQCGLHPPQFSHRSNNFPHTLHWNRHLQIHFQQQSLMSCPETWYKPAYFSYKTCHRHLPEKSNAKHSPCPTSPPTHKNQPDRSFWVHSGW